MKNYFALKSFSFGFDYKKPYFFENIFCEISQPGLIFLVGKNGIGKSTFFRLMQGIVSSSEFLQGTFQIQDKVYDLSRLADQNKLHERSMILHQNFDLMLAPSFTGYQNLAYSLFDVNPGLEFAIESSEVSSFVKSFSIPLEKSVRVLSGGQRQMLAMLMATQKPLDILFLDEPTAALDPKNSDYLMQGIENLAKEKNIVIVCISHDQEIIQKYAKNIIEISLTEDNKRALSIK
jgi:putative ABC transport system ATP-binding protein